MIEKNLDVLAPGELQFSAQETRVLERTARWVKSFHDTARASGVVVMGAHGLDQAKRVVGNAALLAVREGYHKPFVPIIASYLIDVGRTSLDDRANDFRHGLVSAQLTRSYVDRLRILSPEEKRLVMWAIEDHPFLNHQIRDSFVTKLVMDADRLATLGAMAPVRAGATRWKLPLYTGEESSSFWERELISTYQDFAIRIPRWYDSLWTETARKIAKPRIEFLKVFIERFEQEVLSMHHNYKMLGIKS